MIGRQYSVWLPHHPYSEQQSPKADPAHPTLTAAPQRPSVLTGCVGVGVGVGVEEVRDDVVVVEGLVLDGGGGLELGGGVGVGDELDDDEEEIPPPQLPNADLHPEPQKSGEFPQ